MTTANQIKLQEKVNAVINSCKGTEWEKETMLKLKNTLKQQLGMRDLLIDLYFNNHFAA